MRNRKVMIAVFGLWVSDAVGQQCPASVDDSNSRRLLSGMDIVEGPLHADKGDDALLRPESHSDDEYSWKFHEPIGANEVWMLCKYDDTQVVVAQRVGAAATECRVRKVDPATSGESWFTRSAVHVMTRRVPWTLIG